MKFEQFLFTRFNAAVRFAAADRGIQKEWLVHRFRIFETFCLPSVISQKHPGFRWILFVNPKTPVVWLERLEADLRPIELASIVKVPFFDKKFVEAEIQRVTNVSNAEVVISTRLDNDDAIAPKFLADIAFEAQKDVTRLPFILNYIRGCQASSAGIFLKRRTLNPFISVISLSSKLITCFAARHRAMGNVSKVIDKPSYRPMWMQVIHRRNAWNRLDTQQRHMALDSISHFCILPNWQETLRRL